MSDGLNALTFIISVDNKDTINFRNLISTFLSKQGIFIIDVFDKKQLHTLHSY